MRGGKGNSGKESIFIKAKKFVGAERMEESEEILMQL